MRMNPSWSDIRSTLLGSVLRCHTTLTALLILLCAPIIVREGDWLIPIVLVGNWICFAIGKLAWLIRRKLFARLTGTGFALLGTLGGLIALLALIDLFAFLMQMTAGRNAAIHDLFGPTTVAPFLGYWLHMLQERRRWVRWLAPLALLLPLFIQG